MTTLYTIDELHAISLKTYFKLYADHLKLFNCRNLKQLWKRAQNYKRFFGVW